MMNQTISPLSHACRLALIAGAASSVALSANSMAHAQLDTKRGVTISHDDDSRSDPKVVAVLGNAWQVPAQILSAMPAVVGDGFGSSAAMNEDGTVLVVGSSDAIVAASPAVGAIHIFTRSQANDAWDHTQELICPPFMRGPNQAPLPAALSLFGWAVAITGNTIVVGAPILSPREGESLAGQVFVFQKSDDGLWGRSVTTGGVTSRIAHALLTAEDQEAIGYFGGSLAANSVGDITRIAVGSPYRGAANQGGVYIFEGSASSFTQKKLLTSEDGIAQDQFGSKLAISGNALVVGVQSADIDDAIDAGTVFVYRRTAGADGTWPSNPEATFTRAAGVSGDGFGSSVAILDDAIAIGAPGTDVDSVGHTSINEGSVFLFRRVAGAWHADGEIFAREANSNNAFGYAVGLSNGGNQVVVGSPGYESSLVNTGAGFVFTRVGNNTWNLVTSDLWSPSARTGQGLGEQLVVSRDGRKVSLGSRHNAGAPPLSTQLASNMFAWTFSQTPVATPLIVVGSNPTSPDAPGLNGVPPGTNSTGTGTGGATPSTGGFGGSSTPTPATPSVEEWGLVRASVIAINRAETRVSVILTDGNGQLETGSKSIYSLGFYDPTWEVLGVGDVNGDGSSDVLFLVPATRKVKAWIRLGHSVTETITVGTVAAGDRCMGIGDWTKNGFDAPAFLHADGSSANFWIVQGGAVTSKVEFDLGDGPWSFRTGDTNGDSRGEIIARNGDTKRLASLTVAADGTAAINDIANPGGTSILASAVDFDGDGTVDFLWEDQDSHKLEFYFRNTDGTIRFQTPWDPNLSGWKIHSGSAFTTAAGKGVMFSNGGAEVLVLTVRFEALATLPAGRGNIRVDYSRVIGELEKGYEVLGTADEP